MQGMELGEEEEDHGWRVTPPGREEDAATFADGAEAWVALSHGLSHGVLSLGCGGVAGGGDGVPMAAWC